ncbi:hypothetical protein TK44_05300 [Jiulongibacter sediminis]|nr:hypothetical protein TK44_05300 [Jiulongibacter sediminis]
MSMRKLFLMALISLSLKSFSQQTVNDVIAKIKSEVTVDWASQTVDNVKAGNPETEVTGIATTFMATMEVLKKAHAKGLNFVITHEPTFYSHTDNLETHAGDPVQEEKLKYIKDNNMVVWRFHDHIHATKPDQIYEGVIGRFGWEKYHNGDRTYTIPEMTLSEIVNDIESRFGAKTMRIVGDPEAKFSKVGMVLGAAGSGAHFRMLGNPDCELLIVGESNEWETVPYVQDAIELGHNKALIVMGHADSEELGMEYCAEWLKGFYPNMKIEFIEAKNPYWRSK